MTPLDLVAQMVWLPRRLLLMLWEWCLWFCMILVALINIWHAPKSIEVIAWPIFWALFWVEICKVLFQCRRPHPNPRLIGCVMIARAIGRSSHAAHRMPDTTICCVAGYKIRAFPATPNFFPRICFLRQLWSMSSWAPLLCRFPDFYTIIVYTTYPLPCRIVTQPKSWFHT